jgi:hypothetical protein
MAVSYLLETIKPMLNYWIRKAILSEPELYIKMKLKYNFPEIQLVHYVCNVKFKFNNIYNY